MTRLPRFGLLSLILLAGMSIAVLFTWQAIDDSGADQWSYSKLVTAAQAGQVIYEGPRACQARGRAVDSIGAYYVHLPDPAPAC